MGDLPHDFSSALFDVWGTYSPLITIGFQPIIGVYLPTIAGIGVFQSIDLAIHLLGSYTPIGAQGRPPKVVSAGAQGLVQRVYLVFSLRF